MVTPDTTIQHEVNGSVRRRTPSVRLPENPSHEELAQYWTLSGRDKEEVLKRRGRRSVAVSRSSSAYCAPMTSDTRPDSEALTGL
jgi:hypothetical protein